ncbi:lycopene cyclase domain-containing protein [Chitinophaga sedimenti]|uniref:lycopene cyclase domain-containing protein n=1 Tax=Chitinophaga sedimenti TaxID=2033606 RepID=UPI00200435AD|nr:lycopene cyclase domain-containing protein [Chitinophaga sedimenti]MCK7555662.1 lycopene cyclase domain-containing protein [Chitinophaga sedimenti]
MLASYTYLFVNLAAVLICFIFSFDERIQFNRQFGPFLKAAVLVGIPFILWDVWFTANGVWWFNNDYTIGLRLAGLPIEEWLFFICIPFSCVFTYHCLDKFFDLSWASAFNNLLVFMTCVVCAVVALLHHQQMYTLVTALVTIGTVCSLHFITKAPWIGAASFVYLLLMPGFFAVNGVLTGTGLNGAVVNYNPQEFLGIRMLTIPIEDAVYGYSQFLLNIYCFKLFQRLRDKRVAAIPITYPE